MDKADRSRRVHLPSSKEVRDRLKSHSAASCSSSPTISPQEETPSNLDWREVVHQLRQLHQPAEQIRDQMLTDTFG